MIKTIKVKKKMTFRDLLEYIFENDTRKERYISDEGNVINVLSDGTISFENYGYNCGETYEVEVLERITEYTQFDTLIEVCNAHLIYLYRRKRIRDVRRIRSKKFYALSDGELQLVWERE